MAHDWSVPDLIAHRGASRYAPENTLAALTKAKQMRAGWVEFDVALSADDIAVVLHDSTLNRTTNGQGKVAATPYSTIATLDAGSWFAAEYAGEVVPTLEQWLQYAAQLNLGINLEIKRDPKRAELLAQLISQALRAHWPQHLPTPLVSSSSPVCLLAMHALMPELLYGYVTSRWRMNWRSILRKTHCSALSIDHQRLNVKRVAALKQAGYRILAFTVNDKARAKLLLSWGVDSVFSDDPVLLTGPQPGEG